MGDKTPPTIWTLQRLPWNPGGCGMGELWGYKYTPMPTYVAISVEKIMFMSYVCYRDFYIWTFAYDVSGIKNVTFHYREDKDGINSISDTSNEVYESDLLSVGPWISLDMVHRIFPKVNCWLYIGIFRGPLHFIFIGKCV